MRLIGYDELLEEDKYKGFPKEFFSVPGHAITTLDGEDLTGEFRAFIHAPFKQEELVGDRNDTSLALQVVFGDNPAMGGVLMFGDHKYPTIRKIFDVSADSHGLENLSWQVLLAPHHCSKKVMYQDEDGKEVRMQDILDSLDQAQFGAAYIVSSSNCIPAANKPGDNPPHAKAKARYQEIAVGGFVCTHDDGGHAMPLRFSVTDWEIAYDEEGSKAVAESLAAAISAARGSAQTPTTKVGFGWSS